MPDVRWTALRRIKRTRTAPDGAAAYADPRPPGRARAPLFSPGREVVVQGMLITVAGAALHGDGSPPGTCLPAQAPANGPPGSRPR